MLDRHIVLCVPRRVRGFVKFKIREKWVGETLFRMFFLFWKLCVFLLVLFFCTYFPAKKIDRAEDMWGVANPSFSWILNFFVALQDP